jgi:cyanophycinase
MSTSGVIIAIGGHEKSASDRTILKRVVERRQNGGPLVVCTVASKNFPHDLFEEYQKIFKELGVENVEPLHVEEREDAKDERKAELIREAGAVFFTGGDQLKITSQLGDTATFRAIQEYYNAGGTVAGTSAGASVMSETMMVSGPSGSTTRMAEALRLAPGLALLHGVLIDQHFAERGRLGRLLAAVAQNPKAIGIGIDEQTAIVVEGESRFSVIGAGAVHVIDGQHIEYSNVAEMAEDEALSAFNVTLHLLSEGDSFDLQRRKPINGGTDSPKAK